VGSKVSHIKIKYPPIPEKKMAKFEEKFISFLKHFPGLAIIGYEDSTADLLTGSIKQLTGYEEKDFKTGKIRYDQLVHPDDVQRVLADVNRFLSSDQQKTQREYRIIDKNGNIHWVFENVVKFESVKGDKKGIYGVIQDITDRKRTEMILESRYELLNFSADCSVDDLLQKTVDQAEGLTNSRIGFYHFYNQDRQQLTLQVWSSNTLENMCKINDIYSKQHYSLEKAGVWVDCVRKRQPIIHNDYKSLPHKKGIPEGHVFVERELVVPIIRQDKIVAILGVGNKPTGYTKDDVEVVSQLADLAWDMTERKQAQENVKKILQEKELLLKEVHHRIKNDMNIINSLLALQISSSKDPSVKHALAEAQNRIFLMEDIYKILYTQENLQAIDIRTYLVKLVEEIKRTHKISTRVSIDTFIDDVRVSTTHSFPIGIIVNELLANCYNHAFTNQETGAINLSVRFSDEKFIDIVLKDNGHGMPKNVLEGDSAGFGLKLVKAMVTQYNGSLNIDNSNGTTIRITLNY
jgi:PAS domain S-box-containing protein